MDVDVLPSGDAPLAEARNAAVAAAGATHNASIKGTTTADTEDAATADTKAAITTDIEDIVTTEIEDSSATDIKETEVTSTSIAKHIKIPPTASSTLYTLSLVSLSDIDEATIPTFLFCHGKGKGC